MVEIFRIQECDPHFPEEVAREPGCQHLSRCFACGACTASCPVSQVEPGFSPSRILRQIHQGMRRELLESESLWYCLRCAVCSFQCPQDVRFADIMGGLRSLAIRGGIISPLKVARLEEAERLVQQLRRQLIGELLLDRAASPAVVALLKQCAADLGKKEGPG